MGFITEADAGATIVPASMAVIGGLRLSRLLPGGTDNCSSHDDRDTWNEHWGWWFYVNFVASPVNFVDRWAEAQAESRVRSCRAVEVLVADGPIAARSAAGEARVGQCSEGLRRIGENRKETW